MIRKFYSTKAKAGWRFDIKQNRFWSYGFDIYLQSGKRKRESGFASKQLAESAVARIKLGEKENTYNLQTRSFPLVSEVLESAVRRIEEIKPRKRAIVIFNLWLSLIPANLRVNELTTSLIRLYIDKRQGEIKASSINREVTFIASALHSVYLDFPELETWNCPRIPRPKVEKSRRERLITSDEIITLLNYLLSARRKDEKQIDYEKRRVVGQVFQMCLLTGSRVGEVSALSWSQIDFDAKILQIVGRKNRFKTAKNVRYLELNPTIEAILLERKELDKFGAFVFCRSGNSVTDYYSIMKSAAESVGIAYGRNTVGGFVTHDARHTAVTRMLQSGVDLATVGAITGHSDTQLILHYSHATRESRKKATNILENSIKGIGKSAKQ